MTQVDQKTVRNYILVNRTLLFRIDPNPYPPHGLNRTLLTKANVKSYKAAMIWIRRNHPGQQFNLSEAIEK